MYKRGSGILLHPTSLPGPHGIGELGPAAFRLVDWLARAGVSYWQVMPLGPTGYGDSPYASPSAFAGNPNLISLEWLAGEGLLTGDELRPFHDLPVDNVDFGAVVPMRRTVLESAFRRWCDGGGDTSDLFRAFAGGGQTASPPSRSAESAATSAAWLDDYCLFAAISDERGGESWARWPEPLRRRDPSALRETRERLFDRWLLHAFLQFQFRRQWSELKRYANERGIRIVGDIPIFVAYDSADVWANQELFELDGAGLPTVVAGVPPDYFSADGQLWGNPVYRWSAIRERGYAWWIERARNTFELVDMARIDHFRGFAASWSVPVDAATARSGYWTRGPGAEVFEAIKSALGEAAFIVEDLGLITPDVHALRDELGYPGMKVLHFAFDGDPDNMYLPHTYASNSVVFTGTHDNDTTIGWFETLDRETRERVCAYLGRDGADPAWELIRLAFASVADLAIVPLQDVLRLGSGARMNRPGAALGNWSWRFRADALTEGLADGLRHFATIYGRTPTPPKERTFDPFDYTAPGAEHPLH